MSVRQIYYTCCRRGQASGSGFQIHSATAGINLQDQEQAVRLGLHNPLPASPEATPVAFRAGPLASGNMLLQRSRYLGEDYTGREGNFFTHSLIAEEPLPLWAIDYYEWPHWRDALSPEEAEQPPKALPHILLPESTPGESFSYPELSLFLREVPERAFLLRTMLEALLVPPERRKKLIIRDEKENNPYWIACLTKGLPRQAANRLRFSTYQGDAMADLDIIATVPDSAFEFDPPLHHACAVFDLTGKREAENRAAESDAAVYAATMARILQDSPAEAAAFTAYMEHCNCSETDIFLYNSLKFFENPTEITSKRAPFCSLPALLESLLRFRPVQTPRRQARLALVWAKLLNSALRRSVVPSPDAEAEQETCPTPEQLINCGEEIIEQLSRPDDVFSATLCATLDGQAVAAAMVNLSDTQAAGLLYVLDRCLAAQSREQDEMQAWRLPPLAHAAKAFVGNPPHRLAILLARLPVQVVGPQLLQAASSDQAGETLLHLSSAWSPDRAAELRRWLSRNGGNPVLLAEWRRRLAQAENKVDCFPVYLEATGGAETDFAATHGLSCLQDVLTALETDRALRNEAALWGIAALPPQALALLPTSWLSWANAACSFVQREAESHVPGAEAQARRDAATAAPALEQAAQAAGVRLKPDRPALLRVEALLRKGTTPTQKLEIRFASALKDLKEAEYQTCLTALLPLLDDLALADAVRTLQRLYRSDQGTIYTRSLACALQNAVQCRKKSRMGKPLVLGGALLQLVAADHLTRQKIFTPRDRLTLQRLLAVTAHLDDRFKSLCAASLAVVSHAELKELRALFNDPSLTKSKS